MSRFFTKTLDKLVPYTPGEQPRDMSFIKLNTNESPYAPSREVMDKAAADLRSLNLYPDPECRALIGQFAELKGVAPDRVIPGNGSDELLFFAMRAFCDEDTPAVFPDITYSFYPVLAELNKAPYVEIPLTDDLSIDSADYMGEPGTVFIANPNAPTGRFLGLDAVRAILDSRPDFVTIVDEAYVDFGGESAIGLTREYDNLLVIQTFSKSRSLAGARIGFAVGDAGLIADLNTIRYSFNPYNINSMTMSVAGAVLSDEANVKARCADVIAVREYTARRLEALGFTVIPSSANFIFAKDPGMDGGELYRRLKEKGVLVRHFDGERIKDYLRISVGTRQDMDVLIEKIKEIRKDTN